MSVLLRYGFILKILIFYPDWFLSRDGIFELVPVPASFEKAQAFLKEYGTLLVGSSNPNDLVEEKMALDEEARRDLWNIIKTFPFASRERQALPVNHEDAIRAIHGDIQVIEKENSIRSVQYLKEHGKCMDNIVPAKSNIPHAGRGAFATRFIPKGGMVAPAPVAHIADRATANMYNETIGRQGNVVRDETAIVNQQIIFNYMFGHPKSTLLLFPYSSNVAYINHHATEYNAEVRWAKDFSFFHHEEWLSKPVDFLEEQWTSGLMLEFIALRDIQAGEEVSFTGLNIVIITFTMTKFDAISLIFFLRLQVLINYGDEWQAAWDEHVQNWQRRTDAFWSDISEKNMGLAEYIRAEVLNNDMDTPIRTMMEQYHGVSYVCTINVDHNLSYRHAPKSKPYFKRAWNRQLDMSEGSNDIHRHLCNVTKRHEFDDEAEGNSKLNHKYLYTVELEVRKPFGNSFISEFHEIINVPREAIAFENLPYTSDMFLKNSFRHEMKLPDDIFPEAWMNLILEQ